MIELTRNNLKKLQDWKVSTTRKPMVLRGARQVGKSTIVKQFAKSFPHFISLNLDLKEHHQYFEGSKSLEEILAQLFFDFSVPRNAEVLIFLDEIQQSPFAVEQLRYFYEKYPQYHIIAAGSLLETLVDPDIHFPVGRVEYLVMRPVSFDEFLQTAAPKNVIQAFNTTPLPDVAYEKLLQLYHEYALIGGMPEVVSEYIGSKDLTRCNKIFNNLLTAYLVDVEKYARNPTEQQVIRHCIQTIFLEANNRITFQNFGKSNYRSREVGEALRALEKAMITHLVYPATEVKPPLIPDHKKKPRLQVFDTGLMNYYSGLQRGMIGSKDLSDLYKGRVIEHLSGQEILTTIESSIKGLNFWARDKKSSPAEVDYIVNIDSKLIPVEVKSGAIGHLKSLHQFMDIAEHDIAVRLYAGKLKLDNVETPAGKKFRLLNLPYFLASRIVEYVESELIKT